MPFTYNIRGADGAQYSASFEQEADATALQEATDQLNAQLQERAAAAQARQDAGNDAGRAATFGGGLVRGLAQPFAGMAKGAGYLLDSPTLVRGAEDLTARAETAGPMNVAYRDEFLTSKVPQAIGSTPGQILPFFVPVAGPALGLTSGALQTGAGGVDEALAAGADAGTARQAGVLNAALQAPFDLVGEGLTARAVSAPLRARGLAQNAVDHLLERPVPRVLVSGAGEFGTGSAQQVVQNAIAGPQGLNFDPNRKLGDDVLEQGALEAIGGITSTAPGAVFDAARYRVRGPVPVDIGPTAVTPVASGTRGAVPVGTAPAVAVPVADDATRLAAARQAEAEALAAFDDDIPAAAPVVKVASNPVAAIAPALEKAVATAAAVEPVAPATAAALREKAVAVATEATAMSPSPSAEVPASPVAPLVQDTSASVEPPVAPNTPAVGDLLPPVVAAPSETGAPSFSTVDPAASTQDQKSVQTAASSSPDLSTTADGRTEALVPRADAVAPESVTEPRPAAPEPQVEPAPETRVEAPVPQPPVEAPAPEVVPPTPRVDANGNPVTVIQSDPTEAMRGTTLPTAAGSRVSSADFQLAESKPDYLAATAKLKPAVNEDAHLAQAVALLNAARPRLDSQLSGYAEAQPADTIADAALSKFHRQLRQNRLGAEPNVPQAVNAIVGSVTKDFIRRADIRRQFRGGSLDAPVGEDSSATVGSLIADTEARTPAQHAEQSDLAMRMQERMAAFASTLRPAEQKMLAGALERLQVNPRAKLAGRAAELHDALRQTFADLYAEIRPDFQGDDAGGLGATDPGLRLGAADARAGARPRADAAAGASDVRATDASGRNLRGVAEASTDGPENLGTDSGATADDPARAPGSAGNETAPGAGLKTRMDLILDGVEKHGEVTLGMEGSVSREVVQRVQAAAQARGMTAAFDGNNFLIQKNPAIRARESIVGVPATTDAGFTPPEGARPVRRGAVSDRLNVRADEFAQPGMADAVRRGLDVLATIGGRLPNFLDPLFAQRFSVTPLDRPMSTKGDRFGEFEQDRRGPVGIRVVARGNALETALSAAHEGAHLLSNLLAGGGQKMASERTGGRPELARMFQFLRNTDAGKEAVRQSNLVGKAKGKVYDHIRYLADPEEMFARAVEQLSARELADSDAARPLLTYGKPESTLLSPTELDRFEALFRAAHGSTGDATAQRGTGSRQDVGRGDRGADAPRGGQPDRGGTVLGGGGPGDGVAAGPPGSRTFARDGGPDNGPEDTFLRESARRFSDESRLPGAVRNAAALDPANSTTRTTTEAYRAEAERIFEGVGKDTDRFVDRLLDPATTDPATTRAASVDRALDLLAKREAQRQRAGDDAGALADREVAKRLIAQVAAEGTEQGRALQARTLLYDEGSPVRALAGYQRDITAAQAGALDGNPLVQRLYATMGQFTDQYLTGALDQIDALIKKANRTIQGKAEKAVERTLKEQYLDAVSARLQGMADPTAPGQPAALQEFFARLQKTLSAKLTEQITLPARQAAAEKLSSARTIGEALNNWDVYQEAWTQARGDILKENPDNVGLADALDTVLDAPFSGTEAARYAKEAGYDVRELMYRHSRDVANLGRSLAGQLVAVAGLSDAQAKAVERAYGKALESQVNAARRARLEQMVKQAGVTAKEVRPAAERLLRLINVGAFGKEQYYDAIAKGFKLPAYDEALATRVRGLADLHQQLIEEGREGFQTQAVVRDILTTLDAAKRGGFDVAMSVYYANIVSGYTTQLQNLFGNAFNLIGSLAASQAATRGRPGDLAAKFKEVPDTFNALMHGLSRGFPEAVNIMARNEGGVRLDKNVAASNVLEGITTGRLNPLRAYKYVTRFMQAADIVFFRGLQEARTAQLGHLLLRDRGVVDYAERSRLVREMIEGTTAKRQEAEAKATAEGLTGNRYKLRVAEIIEQARPEEINRLTQTFAADETFNGRPHGLLGMVANGINQMSANTDSPLARVLLSQVVPFTNIVANVANATLDYSPVGLLRAVRPREDLRTAKTEFEAGVNLERRSQLAVKGVFGTLAILGLYALSAAHEDEEDDRPFFRLHGRGPSDPDKAKQLRANGWLPYSIQMGDRYFAYQGSPLAIGAAVAANWMDTFRYDKQRDSGAYAQLALGAGLAGRVIIDQSFLQGVSDFFSVFGKAGSPDAATKGVENYLARFASAPVPNLLKQIDRTFDPTTRTPVGFTETALRDYPFVRSSLLRPALNVLGEPVSYQPLQRFTSQNRHDPVLSVLADRNLKISVPSKDQKLGDRMASPSEFYDFMAERGRYLRQMLDERAETLRTMPLEGAQKMLESVAQVATERARVGMRERVLAAGTLFGTGTEKLPAIKATRSR